MTGIIGRPIELEAENFTCGEYPGPNQIRSAYFWNNPTKGTSSEADADGIANSCPASIQKGRDYFMMPKPGYKPFPYPHPLRGM